MSKQNKVQENLLDIVPEVTATEDAATEGVITEDVSAKAVEAKVAEDAKAAEAKAAEYAKLAAEAKAAEDAKLAAEAKANKNDGKKVKIQFLLSPTGKFQLAYNVGEVVKINELQANELIEAGYAEIVK